ncbi:MAG: hypothetical protein M3N50_04875 [Pseudomonadota bacterium]|nr:hypothetical protein [Pseudomonadota bacterium]
MHAYEVGFKSQWFDQALTLNLSIFDEFFNDFRTSVASPGNPFASTKETNVRPTTLRHLHSGIRLRSPRMAE